MRITSHVRCFVGATTLVLLLIGPNLQLHAQEKAHDNHESTEPKIQIGPGDLIEVKVFGVPEMSQTVRVDDVGDASFQLIGRLHLAGLTAEESQGLIAGQYATTHFLVDPQISVFIHEYSTQGASVLGEVAKPGVYPVLGKRSLLDILSEAGGITSSGSNEITVERHSDGSILAVKLSKDARVSLADDIEVQPGDKVIVPRAGIVYVIGDVYRPGGFIMQNDGRITLLQAVALASGTQSTAHLSSARIIRKSTSGYIDIPVDLKKIMNGKEGDQQMLVEDILYIPTHIGKSILYRTVPGIAQTAASASIYRAAY
jgi:polysaccharide export outer membrane protein